MTIELGRKNLYSYWDENLLGFSCFPMEIFSVEQMQEFLTKFDEQEFMNYGQIRKDAFEIFKMKNYKYFDLKAVYDGGKKALTILMSKFCEYKQCVNFIKKYQAYIDKDLIDKLEYDYNHRENVILYKILKNLYPHKKELLEMGDKLKKLNITGFMYTNVPALSLNAIRLIDDRIIQGFYTDGKQTCNVKEKVEFSNLVEYKINIQNAHMILEYNKTLRGRSSEPWLIVNNLLFDTNFLPTYEELYDVNTLPTNLDYKNFEDFKALETEKENITTNVSELNCVSQKINEILPLLEYYTTKLERTKNMEEAKSIVTKLDTLREILADVQKLRTAVIERNDIIKEDEIEKRLYKRHLNSPCHCG